VDYQYPTLGLMTFLVLFLGAFGVAWPIAVRIAEWLSGALEYVVETEPKRRRRAPPTWRRGRLQLDSRSALDGELAVHLRIGPPGSAAARPRLGAALKSRQRHGVTVLNQ